MKRRDVFGSAGAAALCAALLAGTAQAQPSSPLAATETAIVHLMPDAAPDNNRDPVIAAPHGRWAMGVAIGTAIAALASLIGFNGVLRAVAAAGRATAKTAAAATKIPAKAAKAAAQGTARLLASPIRWIAGATAITGALVVTVLILDIQWKAGLAIGAVTAIGGIAGAKRLTGKWQNKPMAAGSSAQFT